MEKKYLKTFCFIAGIILLIPPVCRPFMYGLIRKPEFPQNYVLLIEFIRSSKFLDYQIDWPLLSLELLILLFFSVWAYLSDK